MQIHMAILEEFLNEEMNLNLFLFKILNGFINQKPKKEEILYGEEFM